MSQTIADYYVQQGRQEGRVEGRQEGIRHGQQKVLLRLLEGRFGPLLPDVRQKVLSIQDETTLDRLALRLLDAKGLEDLGLE